jgi:hypothetical protein
VVALWCDRVNGTVEIVDSAHSVLPLTRTYQLVRRYKFFVGVPVDSGHDLTHHNQAGLDTEHERTLEKLLEEEATQYGDLEILPMRDQYMDISNKV